MDNNYSSDQCEQWCREAQVAHDLHEALGVKWGDDPYAVIAKMIPRDLHDRLIREARRDALLEAANRVDDASAIATIRRMFYESAP